jgi:hypothetical protein
MECSWTIVRRSDNGHLGGAGISAEAERDNHGMKLIMDT